MAPTDVDIRATLLKVMRDNADDELNVKKVRNYMRVALLLRLSIRYALSFALTFIVPLLSDPEASRRKAESRPILKKRFRTRCSARVNCPSFCQR